MKTNKTYAGIADEFANNNSANIVLIPVPYAGANDTQSGVSKGPDAFLSASENMELYDIETDSEVYKKGIFLADAITENTSVEAMIDAVHQTTKGYIKKNKFVTVFGSENAVSIGTIRAFNECYNNLTVLHIDAHAELRTEFEGSKLNSACAMNEASQTTNLVQVGIRSMDAIEKTIMDTDKVFFANDMVVNEFWMDEVIDLLGKNVFISFDLDALDPSIFPATTNPVPGGLFWYETLEFLNKVFSEKNVVGFDMVELNPDDHLKNSNTLAANLYYKMLSYKFQDNNDMDEYQDPSKNTNNKVSKFKKDEDEY